MTRYSIEDPIMFDFEALPLSAIALTPNQIDGAMQLSRSARSESQQWQVYLHALALVGFEQWLAEAADLNLQTEHCSIRQPQYANLLETVCQVQVGAFKLCLIAASNTAVMVSRAAIDLPAFIPHFYVIAEVQEEDAQVLIRGCLRYDQLIERQQFAPLTANSDWTYALPIDWFESDEALLLYLRCLSPSAITLPTPVPPLQPASLQATLTPFLLQLAGDRPWWEILSWEQAAAVLSDPDLMSWLHQAQPPNLLQTATQQAINVGLWLRDQMDELAQELSWVLLPPLAAAEGLRSPVEEFEDVVTALQGSGIEISAQARGAYRDVQWAGVSVRLYALAWSLPFLPQAAPEWTLLLILGAQPGGHLPSGIRLKVQDQINVLVDQVLTEDNPNVYLYDRVVGTWDEEFWVTIDLTNGAVVTLPPFAFNPDLPS